MEVVAVTDREKLEKAIERRRIQERERQKRAIEENPHSGASGSETVANDLQASPMKPQEKV